MFFKPDDVEHLTIRRAARGADHFGIPVSTIHSVSAAIMGVGAAKRFSALKWTIVERMAWAWLLTIPVAATIAYRLMKLLQALGYAK
jgi:PiT family inorganic phosphate transporter